MSSLSSAQLRLQAISGHLDSSNISPATSALQSIPAVKLDKQILSVMLDGEDQTWRNWTFDLLKDPLFAFQYNILREDAVRLNQKRHEKLAALNARPKWNEPMLPKHQAINDALSYYDNSLSTMAGAHYGLYSGSIRELGSEELKMKYLPSADSFEVRGCFALTELGHGSNTRGIETEAQWDPREKCYILHTPTTTAQKYWIGAAVMTAVNAIVWAQLYVPNPETSVMEHYGIHAFLVHLRDPKTFETLPGVTIRDCGSKAGLSGMDNGRIWFDHVKVARDHCLNKYGGVNEQGRYESVFPNKEARFGGQLINLSEGRIGIAVSSRNLAKVALATAIRYGLSRRQFGARKLGEPEQLIMDYNLHQRRLYPLLACTYAHHFSSLRLVELKEQSRIDPRKTKQVHVASALTKAFHSWHLLDTLQACREACGGQGLKSSNRIGHLKADSDVMATYEGDNQVMMITVAKGSIGDYTPKKIPALRSLKNTFQVGIVSDATILSSEWQLALFEHHVLCASQRLQAALDTSRQELEAKGGEIQSMDQLLDRHAALSQEFSRALAEHWILEAMVAKEKTDPNGSCLTLLRQLHALWKIENNPDMLRRRYLGIEVQERISDLVNAALQRVHENVNTLVDAWTVPDHLLGTIAGDWVRANEPDGDQHI
ncbi:hypothetical protein BGZ73_002673 [Actinomortierella ambigua]|nr:hypothetical protein BGZ73_002673 [Actinomortierella ambigua]